MQSDPNREAEIGSSESYKKNKVSLKNCIETIKIYMYNKTIFVK